MLAERRLPGPRLTARADDVTLLLAEERVGEGFHVHAGVGETAWFVHAFGVGPIPELPATEPGSASLGDALERALAGLGPGRLGRGPRGGPARACFDTLAWALERHARLRRLVCTPGRAFARSLGMRAAVCHSARSSAISSTIPTPPRSTSRARPRSSRSRCGRS